MKLPSLLVMVPTRGRREQCEIMLKSFRETTDDADILFVTDDDDQDTYADMDWGSALTAVFSPRGSLTQVLNRTALTQAPGYDVLMYAGDDHVFRTPHWDAVMLKALKNMGGSGMLYPDSGQRPDIPEILMTSSDIVRELGHFAEPSMGHFYHRNAWNELGKRAGVMRYCPQVVIEHVNYDDETYESAKRAWGEQDFAAYQNWRAGVMPMQISALRRAFNPDTAWVRRQF